METIIYNNDNGHYYTGHNDIRGPVFSDKFELAKIYSNSHEAVDAIPVKYWELCSIVNISIDLIYGLNK